MTPQEPTVRGLAPKSEAERVRIVTAIMYRTFRQLNLTEKQSRQRVMQALRNVIGGVPGEPFKTQKVDGQPELTASPEGMFIIVRNEHQTNLALPAKQQQWLKWAREALTNEARNPSPMKVEIKKPEEEKPDAKKD